MTGEQSNYDVFEIRGHKIALRSHPTRRSEVNQLPTLRVRREVPCPFCTGTAHIARVDPTGLGYECTCGGGWFKSRWAQDRDFLCANCHGLYLDHEVVLSKRYGSVLVCPDAFEGALFRFTTPLQELRDGVPYADSP